MDLEQIQKQLEWFEKERREDKQIIANLKKRVEELETMIDKTNGLIRDVDTEVTKVGVRVTKLDTFDDAILAHRKEVKKELDGIEKRLKGRENYAKNQYQEEIVALKKDMTDLGKELKVLPGLRRDIDDNEKSYMRVNTAVDELKKLIKDETAKNQTYEQSIQLLDEDLSSNKKRFADIQGELAALRKRLEEQRGQQELVVESNKKLDIRINELMASEEQRRQTQLEFTEKITRSQLDVERAFKEWTTRFDDIEKRAQTLTEALQTYGEIERSLRSAQNEFDDITEQINRRIHEITEIQRLGEERFRQEWTTFKSDDQKRWVNYTLTQDEQAKEVNRRLERLTDRTTTLEEVLQDLQDAVQHSAEQLESLMQSLLGVYREWLTVNERFSDTL
jgi:chromosome segregation ATPase